VPGGWNLVRTSSDSAKSLILWRRGRESNPSKRLCRPLHNLFATSPEELLVSATALFRTALTKREARLPFVKFWSGRRVSNSRPQPWQGCALPTELLPHWSRPFYYLLYYLLHAPVKHWSGRRVSNSRPQPWQGCALPTELLPHLQDNDYRRKGAHFQGQPHDVSPVSGAGEESRTLDLNLGKVALYQLSYSRIVTQQAGIIDDLNGLSR
jgi:hypothetical protein